MHVPIERMIDREGNMMNRVMLAPKQTKEDDKKHAERRKERKKERERKRERERERENGLEMQFVWQMIIRND